MRIFTISVMLCFCLSSRTSQAQFSDLFDGQMPVDQWNIFMSGAPDYYLSLVCNDSLLQGNMLADTEGRLVITCGNTYWYANVTGPYLYQYTWGDFTATANVRSLNRYDTDNPPDREYNSTGLLVRNPNDANGQNYIMTNLGMQSNVNGIGSESKTTVNSSSILYLDPDLHEGQVRIEREGTIIRTYKRTGADEEFILLDAFDRPDLPDTVQIGMILNGYTNNPDIRGEFESVEFTGGDCRIVRHTADSGINSFREAIACAANSDTIWFDHAILGGSMLVSEEPLVIDKNLVLYNITGEPLEIELDHMLSIAEGVQVEFHRLHLQAGSGLDSVMVQNNGTLHFIGSTLSGNGNEEVLIENAGQVFIDGTCILDEE